jgi:hypothetical protein
MPALARLQLEGLSGEAALAALAGAALADAAAAASASSCPSQPLARLESLVLDVTGPVPLPTLRAALTRMPVLTSLALCEAVASRYNASAPAPGAAPPPAPLADVLWMLSLPHLARLAFTTDRCFSDLNQLPCGGAAAGCAGAFRRCSTSTCSEGGEVCLAELVSGGQAARRWG